MEEEEEEEETTERPAAKTQTGSRSEPCHNKSLFVSEHLPVGEGLPVEEAGLHVSEPLGLDVC